MNRALTVGLLMMVTISAFQALGVGTVLPAAARELDGLDAYGWAFSATMLASVAGNVAAGQAADGRGPVRPFLAGSAVFTAGCVVAAAAGDWPVMLAGRALEGAGLGAIGSLTYVALARAYPPEQYGRVLALTSAAWVLPSLVGPPLAGVIAQVLSWRAVFVLFLPLVPLGIALTLPSLRRMERGAQAVRAPSRLGSAAALIAGFGLFLLALELDPLPAVVLGAAGVALGAPALRRLLPRGTLRAARGLPASMAVRGALAVAFLGCDAFLPLALVRLRGLTLAQAGLVVSAGSVSWSLGAMLQGRRDRRDKGAGRAARALDRGGRARRRARAHRAGAGRRRARARAVRRRLGRGRPRHGARVQLDRRARAGRRAGGRGGQRLERAAAGRDGRRSPCSPASAGR